MVYILGLRGWLHSPSAAWHEPTFLSGRGDCSSDQGRISSAARGILLCACVKFREYDGAYSLLDSKATIQTHANIEHQNPLQCNYNEWHIGKTPCVGQ